MSQESATRFREGLQADQELSQGLTRVLAAKLPAKFGEPLSADALNTVIQYAVSHGYSFTPEEAQAEHKRWLEARLSSADRELSAAELDLVAGGSAGWAADLEKHYCNPSG